MAAAWDCECARMKGNVIVVMQAEWAIVLVEVYWIGVSGLSCACCLTARALLCASTLCRNKHLSITNSKSALDATVHTPTRDSENHSTTIAFAAVQIRAYSSARPWVSRRVTTTTHKIIQRTLRSRVQDA